MAIMQRADCPGTWWRRTKITSPGLTIKISDSYYSQGDFTATISPEKHFFNFAELTTEVIDSFCRERFYRYHITRKTCLSYKIGVKQGIADSYSKWPRGLGVAGVGGGHEEGWQQFQRSGLAFSKGWQSFPKGWPEGRIFREVGGRQRGGEWPKGCTLDPRVAFYEILLRRISFNFTPATDW